MTIAELASAFKMEYARECFKRQLKQLDIHTRQIAFDISKAQQDIQRRLDVVRGSTIISTVDGTNLYNLPSDFSKLKLVSMGVEYPLDIESDIELLKQQTLNGDPAKCGVYVEGNTSKLLVYPTPNSVTDLYVYYSVDTNYYQPTESSSQNWGIFDGSNFTGKLLLPDRFDNAVLLFMLSQWFDDFIVKYEKELTSLRMTQSTHVPIRTKYEFGMPKRRNIARGSTVIPTTTTSSSNANRVLQLYLSQAGTSAPVVVSNFSSNIATPALARTSAGIYTLTLADAFPSASTFLYAPNIDIASVDDEDKAELIRTSDNVLTLKVYDSLNNLTDGFNSIHIKVEVAP